MTGRIHELRERLRVPVGHNGSPGTRVGAGDRRPGTRDGGAAAFEARLDTDEVSIVHEEGYRVGMTPPTGQEVTTNGYRPEEFHGEPVGTVMSADDVEQGGELVEAMVTGDHDHVTFEMEIRSKDDEALPSENRMVPLQDDDPGRGTVSVLRTRRGAGDAVYTVASEGRLTFSNEGH